MEPTARRYVLSKGSTHSLHFRLRVPSDLRALIGRNEIRRSLGTSCLAVACHRAYVHASGLHRVFDQLGAMELDTLQIKTLARQYVAAALEVDESGRARGFGCRRPQEVTQPGLDEAYEQRLQGLYDNLVEGRADAGAFYVDWFCRRHHIDLNRADPLYPRLCREFLKAHIQVVEIMSHRADGDYEYEEGADLGATAPPSEARTASDTGVVAPVKTPAREAPHAPMISNLMAEYLRALTAEHACSAVSALITVIR